MKTLEEIKAELNEEIPVHYHLPNPEPRLHHADLMKLQALHACSLVYIQALEACIAQLERERDAALHDLKNSVDACMVCKWLGEECRSRNELNECTFEWRGVCSENTKEDPHAD